MIRLVLTGIESLETKPLPPISPESDDQILVDVVCCAICRTDAKMWSQGHRDLVFPRVLGHEMVVQDKDGKRFMVWPGQNCGKCPYCLSNRENLCDEMKITGFHTDGGFAHKTVLQKDSLIPIPNSMDTRVACFGEPVGCVVNAFEKFPKNFFPPGKDAGRKKILIYGAGTMGLITALYAKSLGLSPLVLEKQESKIQSVTPFLEATGIPCVKETRDSLFELVITACPDYIALCQAITKVDKGGHLSFFSGITKNEHIETNLLNLVHYKEAVLSGAYGMKKQDMEKAIPFLSSHAGQLLMLVQETLGPDQAPSLMPEILAGNSLKYIIDFTSAKDSGQAKTIENTDPVSETFCRESAGPFLEHSLGYRTIRAISPLSKDIMGKARAKMDEKTKPLGALGRLEELGIQMSMIQESLFPRIQQKNLFVFAGDHGITEEGVSAFPSEVTGQMVDNFLNGGAAINVLCRHHNIDMKVVDMGVKKEFAPHPDLIRAKVAEGTNNMAISPAMSLEDTVTALESGMEVFFSAHGKKPVDILGLGEMGIGNTSSATAIICAATGITPAQATGRGTGVDDHGLSHKREVIERVLNFHKPDPGNGFEILMKMGGFEIAGIAGAVLASASKGCAVVLDGVISTAGGLIAYLINPGIQGYLIAGHKSVEKAQASALAHMGLTPVLDLDLRLGEGTGAALAIDLAETACKIMDEMASFEEAKISRTRTI